MARTFDDEDDGSCQCSGTSSPKTASSHSLQARPLNNKCACAYIQITKIEDLTSSTDPSTLATSNATTAYDTAPSKTQNLNLTISILQSDLSRTQYLIRSLLRQRLAKLSKYAPYYLALSNGTLPPQSSASQSYYDEYGAEKETPLSASETDFLRAHQDLLKAHYDISFLHSFPQSLTRLDDNNGGVSMIQGPETKSPVFVRCLVERGWVVERDGMGEGHERGDMETAGEDELVMQQGDIWVTRWEGVREGVRRGILEVL